MGNYTITTYKFCLWDFSLVAGLGFEPRPSDYEPDEVPFLYPASKTYVIVSDLKKLVKRTNLPTFENC